MPFQFWSSFLINLILSLSSDIGCAIFSICFASDLMCSMSNATFKGLSAWLRIKLNWNKKNSYERHFHCGFSSFVECIAPCIALWNTSRICPADPSLRCWQQQWGIGSAGQFFWPVLKQCGLTCGGVKCVTSHDITWCHEIVTRGVIWYHMM